MKKYILLPFFVFVLQFVNAQTYTSNAGGPIPDAGAQVIFPLIVSGLSPSSIDTTFGLETICFTITHSYDADLNISLEAPDGTIVDLSIANGGEGDNYTNTCINAFATGSIVTGAAPFTGIYQPQGFIYVFNNGQNGNGVWNLLVQDTYALDSGNVIDWSITFGNTPAKPFSPESSNLPIVVINTLGQNITDEPKVQVHMGIIYNGPGLRNYLTDPFNNYNNKVGIELRGSTSQGFPQKSANFETRDINGVQKDTIILGLPAEHDWILYAPYDDKTCMRNVLSYDIANKTGHYAPRTVFCELIVNGQYQGIYVLMEKIKRDANRVNISKLLPTDTIGDELTGGYIIKIDRVKGDGTYWTSNYLSSVGSDINFSFEYPKNGIITQQQKEYIQSYLDTFETVLSSVNFTDPLTGYRKYTGVNTFIDYFILNEISKNVDGYRLSTFLYKDKQSKGGKLKIGPAWDYNLGWWNADYCEGDLSTGWAYDFSNVCSGDNYQLPFWWERLLQDPTFTAQLKCRWNELRLTTLSLPVLNNFVDSIANYLDEAQARHFTTWPILGAYTWPNPSPIPADYPGEITALKTWIVDRIAWMDANMPGICNVGIYENTLNESNVTLFPNPFNSSFHVNFYLSTNDNFKIYITDILGNIVKNIEQNGFHEGSNTIEIDLSNNELKNGMYFLNIISNRGSIVKKLTKVE